MKKVGKKLVALSLVSAMAVSGLAACGQGGDDTKETKPAGTEAAGTEGTQTEAPAEGVTLKVAAFEGGNGKEIWEKIADAFEAEHEGVTVDLHTSSELDQDLTKDIQNGDIPDVVYYNLGQKSGFTENMLKENAVADISDVFDDELRGRILDGILDGTDAQPYGDGKIYLAPIFYSPTGFWYNKDFFEGENAKYTLPETWEDMFKLGDELEGTDTALFTYPVNGYFDSVIFAMLEQAGGMDFYQNALKYDANTWTSEEGKKVLDTVGTLVSKYTHKDTVSNATSGNFKVISRT